MNHPDYNAPVALKAFMEQNGMAMQKKFGQNFMVNPAARTKIVDMLAPENGAPVWEIGPGLGCMTNELLERGADMTVFEIDRGFISLLHQFFSAYEQKNLFKIVEGDVLKTWQKELALRPQESTGQIRLFGNLPYNIAATFIADTITQNLVFNRCVFTIQKEVAQRMCAGASSDQYSAFSVLCQWLYDVKPGIELAPGNFWPRPNVASQAVLLTPKVNPYPCSNSKLFVKVVHTLFAQRRKTLLNNIKSILPPSLPADELFARTGIAKSERAENLRVEDFIRLSETLNSAIVQAE